MAKLTDIWKPRETLRDWGKTEYKIIRNWTPRAPPPISNRDTTGPDKTPIKFNLSTTLRSCRGNQRMDQDEDAHKKIVPLDDGDHASETDSDGETISSLSRSTRSSVHTKIKPRALTKSRLPVDRTDIVHQMPNVEDPLPNNRGTSESCITGRTTPSSSARDENNDTSLTGLELKVSETGSRLITDELFIVQSSKNANISKARSATKRRKRTSRVSYPRKKAASKKSKIVVVEQNDSKVTDPTSTGVDPEPSDSRTNKENDVESETITAVLEEMPKGGTQPSSKNTSKNSEVQLKTVERPESTTSDESDVYVIDNESDLKSKTATKSTSESTTYAKKITKPTKRKTSTSRRLTLPKRPKTNKTSKTAHQAIGLTDGSDSDIERDGPTMSPEGGPTVREVDDDGGVLSDNSGGDENGTQHTINGPLVNKRAKPKRKVSTSKRLTMPKRPKTIKTTKPAHKANGGHTDSDSDTVRSDDDGGVSDSSGGDENVTGGAPQSRKRYAALHTHLWQPRRFKRGKKDFSELDVCLNVYEDAIKSAVESCSNQTVSMAMVTHWKYTRKEILNLIKNSYFTIELQKLKRKEKLKQKGLERKMATVLTNLRKTHGKYQESLSQAKQAKKIEQEVSLKERLNSVAGGIRRVWQAQQHVEH